MKYIKVVVQEGKKATRLPNPFAEYVLQGVQASLIGVLPYAAIRLGVYDGLKWNHRRATKQEHIKPLPTMLYGAFAGLLSASATFPVEVVR